MVAAGEREHGEAHKLGGGSANVAATSVQPERRTL